MDSIEYLFALVFIVEKCEIEKPINKSFISNCECSVDLLLLSNFLCISDLCSSMSLGIFFFLRFHSNLMHNFSAMIQKYDVYQYWLIWTFHLNSTQPNAQSFMRIVYVSMFVDCFNILSPILEIVKSNDKRTALKQIRTEHNSMKNESNKWINWNRLVIDSFDSRWVYDLLGELQWISGLKSDKFSLIVNSSECDIKMKRLLIRSRQLMWISTEIVYRMILYARLWHAIGQFTN